MRPAKRACILAIKKYLNKRIREALTEDKDATMAHFIIKNLQPNAVFLHYNGTYHSDNFEGISWYLKKSKPELKIITIATVEQKDISKLEKEHLNKADFILVIDEDATKTY